MGSGNAGSTRPPGGGTGEPELGALTPSDRDRILQALTECCAERGYQQTSVEQVVARAGVDRSTFDLTFRDKEACALEALNKLASEILTTTASIRDVRAEDESAEELARLRAALELTASQPAAAYVGWIEARQGGTERLHHTYEASMHLASVMISRAYAATIGAALPIRTARAALGGGEALVRREVASGRAAQLPQLLPDLAYSALVPLVGQEKALRLMRVAGPPASE